MVQSQGRGSRHGNNNATNIDALEMELKTMQEIHRLRNEIHQLSIAERGGYGPSGVAVQPPPPKVASCRPTTDRLVLNSVNDSPPSSLASSSHLCPSQF